LLFKSASLILPICFTSFFCKLGALPIGNPYSPEMYTKGVFFENGKLSFLDTTLRLGFWGNYVFNRSMQWEKAVNGTAQNVETFSIYKNQAVCTLTFLEKFDLFGLIGVSNFSQSTPFYDSLGQKHELFDLTYEPTVSYGGGVRVLLYRLGLSTIGLQGQFFSAHPKLSSYIDYTTGFVNYPSNVASSFYIDYQGSISVAYKVATKYGTSMIPYLGLRFSDARLFQNNEVYNGSLVGIYQSNLSARKLVGYSIGITTLWQSKSAITIEGQLASEKSVLVSGELRL
jgi:hypothetical protein